MCTAALRTAETKYTEQMAQSRREQIIYKCKKAVPPEYSSDTAFNIMCLFSSRKQSVDKLTCKPRGTVSSFERKALGKEVELILRNINALLLCKTVHDMR